MITITLDAKQFANVAKANLDLAIQTSLHALQSFAMDHMEQLSAAKLPIPQQKEFKQALQVEAKPGEFVISLTTDKASRIEEGYPSFDIKPGLLKSTKAKRTKKGNEPYVDIPFRHKLGKRGVGKQIVARSMREAVRKAVTQAKATGHQQRVSKKRSPHRDVVVMPEGDILSYRRVSKKSAPDAWIHPGLKGLGIFTQVAQTVERIKDRVVQDTLNKLLLT